MCSPHVLARGPGVAILGTGPGRAGPAVEAGFEHIRPDGVDHWDDMPGGRHLAVVHTSPSHHLHHLGELDGVKLASVVVEWQSEQRAQ
jgi:hypothetical protein